MNIYIYEYLSPVSVNYHSGGGVAIIAPTHVRAKEILAHYLASLGTSYATFDEEEVEEALKDFDKSEYDAYPIEAPEERIYVFEDAGCC